MRSTGLRILPLGGREIIAFQVRHLLEAGTLRGLGPLAKPGVWYLSVDNPKIHKLPMRGEATNNILKVTHE